MRSLSFFMAAALLGAAVITGCSSSTGTSPGDSGTDSPTGNRDTGPHKDGQTGTDGHTGKDGQPGNDTGTAGPCNFAVFGIGRIKNDTTATAVPSTNLGQSCTDDQKQSDFASLF
jgi:hypothetical protein